MAFISTWMQHVLPAPEGPRAIMPWRTRWVSNSCTANSSHQHCTMHTQGLKTAAQPSSSCQRTLDNAPPPKFFGFSCCFFDQHWGCNHHHHHKTCLHQHQRATCSSTHTCLHQHRRDTCSSTHTRHVCTSTIVIPVHQHTQDMSAPAPS